MSTVLYKVRARAIENIVTEQIFGKEDLYQTIVEKNPELRLNQDICISDVFVAGFVYKPISFDCVCIRSDEEYRVLKQIKSAKYIEKTLLKKVKNGEDLIRAVMYGQAYIQEEHICDSMEEKRTTFRRIVDPERCNPMVLQIPKGCEVDFYIRFGGEPQSFLKPWDVCQIGTFSIRIETVEERIEEIQDGRELVLQSTLEMRVGTSIKSDSKSMFRVGYNGTSGYQYFKAGSVLDKSDAWLLDGVRMKPYWEFMGESR